MNECCEIRDELWQSATGFDFLGDVTRRLDSFTANLNALARRQRGEVSRSANLPDEVPAYLNLLGLEWRAMVPSTWNGEPISVYQQMANLCSATAICATHAIANARWAVNEHVRAERVERQVEAVLLLANKPSPIPGMEGLGWEMAMEAIRRTVVDA